MDSSVLHEEKALPRGADFIARMPLSNGILNLVALKDVLWSVRGLAMKRVCHPPGNWRLTLLRSGSMGLLLHDIVLRVHSPHGLTRIFFHTLSSRDRALDIVPNRANLLNIDVTDEVVSV